MVLFPNCKINLALQVTGKRADGFHNLNTVFYPLPLYDAAEIILNGKADKEFDLRLSGNPVDGELHTNLCFRAWKLLKEDFPQLPSLKMFLHKSIPSGGGLGGGSSDGVFTLRIINELLHLNLDDQKLHDYALQLGSDCPFFLLNKPCVASGRGEIMKAITLNLNDYYFVVVHPGIHVSTSAAFNALAQYGLKEAPSDFEKLLSNPIDTWKDVLFNDFEQPVFDMHPELKNIKEQLYSAGAKFALMTGTGSCVYGMFEVNAPAPHLTFPGTYNVYHLNNDV